MNAEALTGLIGGIAGSALGLLGGAVGTWYAIRATRGPRERAFAIRASICAWVLMAAFLGGLLLIPGWYRFLLFIPYGILLPLGIRAWNRTQQRLRQEESVAPPLPGASGENR